MKDGILNINKPADWTSQDVCSKLRHRLRIKKIGHTGTLDPMATGVLPVCIGKATRIIEYYDLDLKSYHAGMKLGTVTDTLDIWGNVITQQPVRITRKEDAEDDAADILAISEDNIRSAFAGYTGNITQIPPKYSALKINGKRAYDLARQGADFEIKGREITIFSNKIAAIGYDTGTIEFDVICSKGTYIRTICDDIGRALGCGAVMTSLVRTGSGCFDLSDAIDLEKLVEMPDEELCSRIIPMEDTLRSLGTVQLDDNRFTAFINGNSSGTGYRVTSQSHFTDGNGSQVYKVFSGGRFLGTAVICGRDLVPAKVIFTDKRN